ncbi:cupin domain-containing protein [Actinoplanes sp. NPDC051494]|uniref:cupin domain-containing protein n=1 Tax=Actinoplanes sp. NPDC051494 TaxID=3363907 RepID=UPI003798D702
MTTTPLIVRADTAETLSDGPTSLITLLADAAGGALTVNRSTLRQGSPGAPVHFHKEMIESFFVLDGSLRVLAGEQVLTLGKGDFVSIPKLLPHAFDPAPGAEVDVLVMFTPGLARFDYYRLLERVFRGEADPSEFAAAAEKFDNHYSRRAAWEARDAG